MVMREVMAEAGVPERSDPNEVRLDGIDRLDEHRVETRDRLRQILPEIVEGHPVIDAIAAHAMAPGNHGRVRSDEVEEVPAVPRFHLGSRIAHHAVEVADLADD